MSELYNILENSLDSGGFSTAQLNCVVDKMYGYYVNSIMRNKQEYEKMCFCISTLISISGEGFKLEDLLLSMKKYVELYPFVVELKNEIIEKGNSIKIKEMLKELYEIDT